MKKAYMSPLADIVLLPATPVLLDVSEGPSIPGVDSEAPARKEFAPSFDHGNLV